MYIKGDLNPQFHAIAVRVIILCCVISHIFSHSTRPSILFETNDGNLLEYSDFNWETLSAESSGLTNATSNTKISPIIPGNSVFLHYVEGFISDSEATQMISICDNRNGWKQSPIKAELSSNGDSSELAKKRTSSSCPLLWPALYKALATDPNAFGDDSSTIIDEFNLAYAISKRAAELMKISVDQIEPLQIVRYRYGEFYQPHHDHGSYYGNLSTHL